MLRIPAVALLFMLPLVVCADPHADVGHATLAYRGPVAYSDKRLQRVFYVESDGQHLSCIDFDGKLRWTRVPFVEAKLEPYRLDKPRIVFIGPALPSQLGGMKDDDYIAITFESTQFGIVEVDSGKFHFLGQD